MTLASLYLVFCITSEATLSGSDLKSAWKGFVGIVFVLFVLNLIPVVAVHMHWFVALLEPWLFPIHAIMAFVLIVDIAFFVTMFVLHHVFAIVFRHRSGN